MPEQTVQTGESKLQMTVNIKSKRQKQNNIDHEIQFDLDRTYEH